MSFSVATKDSIQGQAQQTENKHFSLNSLSGYVDVTKLYPPNSLSSSEVVELGVRYLEKFGESAFNYFQREYQLTKAQSEEIFSLAKEYSKDLSVMTIVDPNNPKLNETYKEEVALIQGRHPNAKFYELYTKEENHRQHQIVEIDGKMYYFYSKAYKGPVVDPSYIDNYSSTKDRENRPDFKVLHSDSIHVFLMEFKGDKTPNFREEEDIRMLIDLIVQFSKQKKGLDMLPCRLAKADDRIYCVDQKPHYGKSDTSIEAFKNNLGMLKSKIEYRGYAEQGALIAFVDRIAEERLLQIFERDLEEIPYSFQVVQKIPPSSLNHVETLNLGAAYLRKFGVDQFYFFAREYKLSREDQKQCRKLSGEKVRDNTITWDSEIPESFRALQEKTQKALDLQGKKGQFLIYENRIGNYKTVLTVTVDGQVYVVHEASQDYIERYQEQKEREHRPDFMVLPYDDGSFIFFSKFMGSQTLDYGSERDLDLIIELALNFSEGATMTIDFNAGNLVVQDNHLFYIDKDLSYVSAQNPKLKNVEHILYEITSNLYTPAERSCFTHYVKNKLYALLDPSNPGDLEILKFLFPEAYLPPRPTFEQFLNQLDLTVSADCIRLSNEFVDYFHTEQDFAEMNDRILEINKRLENPDVDPRIRILLLQIIFAIYDELKAARN